MRRANGERAQCSACRHFQPAQGAWPSQCRANHPQVVPQPTYYPTLNLVQSMTYQWPLVVPEDWCSKFEEE